MNPHEVSIGGARPRKPGGKRRTILIAAVLVAATALTAWFLERDRGDNAWRETWAHTSRNLPPSGGKPFEKRLIIPVPSFLQSDPRWGADPLGPSTKDTLASAGCAVSSAAMILASYGADTDPQRLNDFLQANNGFTPQAWIEWQVAAQVCPKKKLVYEGDASYQLIDQNLEAGNPVIVRIRYQSGMTHFVVICGKDGSDYLINDPGKGGAAGVYPLKNLGSNIEALRYYFDPPPDGKPQ